MQPFLAPRQQVEQPIKVRLLPENCLQLKTALYKVRQVHQMYSKMLQVTFPLPWERAKMMQLLTQLKRVPQWYMTPLTCSIFAGQGILLFFIYFNFLMHIQFTYSVPGLKMVPIHLF